MRYLLVLIMIFPRMAISYGGYFLSSLLLIDWKHQEKNKILLLLFIFSYFITIHLMNQLLTSVSITAFVLEIILITPLIFFIIGLRINLKSENAIYIFRWINILLLITSVYNLILNGFPIKLPYIDYLPDEYFGLYGIGGARIITLFGFFGILTEYKKWKFSNIYFIVSIANFLIPSYIIGIIGGMIGLFIFFLFRYKWLILPTILISIPITYYIFYRLENMNNVLMDIYGYHPKLLAYLIVVEIYNNELIAFLFGTSLGQFTSTAALWSSETIQYISIHNAPTLPMLFSSDYHLNYMNEYLEWGYQNKYIISSAANKPFTSISTLLIEIGFPMTIFFVFLFIQEFKTIIRTNQIAIVAMFFVIFLFCIDTWHDNLWLGFMLLLYKATILNFEEKKYNYV